LTPAGSSAPGRFAIALGALAFAAATFRAGSADAHIDEGRNADASQTGMTMQLGRGLGPYRIGAERRDHAGLIRTIRQPRNDSGGCSGSFDQDSFVDVYPRLRLGYIFTFKGDTYLDTIATARTGDRTSLGYTIGKSSFADVRGRYRTARVSRHLGGRTLTVFHQTGYETWAYLRYSFNATGALAGLETSVGGC
jgi:hypothetical protein